MFEVEQKTIESSIKDYCQEKGLPVNEVKWAWIPFNGQWGIATSFFALAATSFGQTRGNVAQRATERPNPIRLLLTPSGDPIPSDQARVADSSLDGI